jgi:hypothetical protein
MPIESLFPRLKDAGYQVMSPQTVYYNCVAWAAHEDDRWWWPDPSSYWPEGAPREVRLEAFVHTFSLLGYEPCDAEDLEPGFEKIAIYVGQHGLPTHVARQLSNGRWTSKLGKLEDIEHSLAGLSNSMYGQVAQIMRRPTLNQ